MTAALLLQPSRHLADTIAVPGIFSSLKKVTNRKLEWLLDVISYLYVIYIIMVFAALCLVNNTLTV
jgi:hypothetical protein